MNGTGPLVPHAREKINLSLDTHRVGSTNPSIRASNRSRPVNLLDSGSYFEVLDDWAGNLP